MWLPHWLRRARRTSGKRQLLVIRQLIRSNRGLLPFASYEIFLMLTFLKLGGSLITDKRVAGHFHAEMVRRTAQEIAAARIANPELQIVIGHGSGSFGHVVAQKYGTANGVYTSMDWLGYAEVATAARALNALVMDILHAADLPVFGLQPSASAACHDGELQSLVLAPIQAALDHGLIPVVYGDVALDDVRGGAIVSTEALFFYLAEHLQPARILLLGEAEGVYGADGTVISRITPHTLEQMGAALGGSHGTDVTGGMAAKVRTMVALVERLPNLHIGICGGTHPGQLTRCLTAALNDELPGTMICND
jgi:isopentenyl phosphate kinase